MSFIRCAVLAVAVSLLFGCSDALERTARASGIPPEDAHDIIRNLRAEKHPHVVYTFSRVPAGTIYVSTDIGDFLVEGSRGKWRFTEMVFYSRPHNTSNQAMELIAARTAFTFFDD